MKSVMSHNFSRIPDVRTQRSKFNRSHAYKTTFDVSLLIPCFVDEALPGDTFNVKMTSFARLSTPLAPIMDNLYLDTFFFAVPYRLVWENWEKFNGMQVDPGDSTDYEIPIVAAPVGTGHLELSLSDYLGIPTKVASLETSSLWHRAYNLIWNEWFRDQNLQDSAHVDVDDGPDTIANYASPASRCKKHDYFTSCLPWPQKGDSVELPLGDNAPITGLGKRNQTYAGAGMSVYETDGSGTTAYTNYQNIGSVGANDAFDVEEDPNNTGYPNIRADLSTATASTINELRQAFQVQKMLERDARGGTRYVEVIKNHFGVTSPDFRLQRPEYLGGGSQRINITAVPQTSETNTTPQGTLTGYGTSSGQHGFSKSFTEHCLLLGLVNVRGDITYQEGINRMFNRRTRYDFFWPSLANIGEQAVLNKEIYADNSANDELVFGYQERYAEYRYKPSQITGLFRSNATASLDHWHLSQEFGALPTLGNTFIKDATPADRVVATPSEPHIIFDSYFDMICVRPMPVYSVPGKIDHF